MSSILCPFCFEKVDKKKLEYRCKNHPVPQPVPRLTGNNNPICPFCGRNVYLQVCPKCENEIPDQYIDAGNVLFAVIGPKNVGKTQFTTVLVHELERSFSTEFDVCLSTETSEYTTSTKARNESMLYSTLEVIPETNSAVQGENATSPMIYTLGRGSNKVNLVFYDTAGEDLNASDKMYNSTIHKYIANSTGIIFLVDPLQFDYVRNRISDKDCLPNKIDTSIQEVLSRSCNIIRTVNDNLKKSLKIKLAIVLTKIDVLTREPTNSQEEQIFFDSLSSVRANRDRGHYDAENFDKLNEEVERFVERATEGAFTQYVKNNFHKGYYRYFVTSSLGQAPKDHHQLCIRPNPFRIEDSMIWLLNETTHLIPKK